MAILGQEVPKSLIFALFIFLQALFPPVCCPNLRKVYLVMVLMVSAATALILMSFMQACEKILVRGQQIRRTEHANLVQFPMKASKISSCRCPSLEKSSFLALKGNCFTEKMNMIQCSCHWQIEPH
ncbi:hypothetical protein KC19_6G169000 [Ceratodon purpureus]|uniref:Uncharacterized protein n=1 Tax=Ceratodon purpureus TaxID=3225 RepID=A0A8T0HFI0_CERPU|nr:hypothetical protein KC19_6G169000 [Ceratodon purpureus]